LRGGALTRIAAMVAGGAALLPARIRPPEAAVLEPAARGRSRRMADLALPERVRALRAARGARARDARRQPRARWFWTGRIARVSHVVAAMGWAALLLALAVLLDRWHWVVLAADAVFLGLIAGTVARRLASDVPEARVGLVARRWAAAGPQLRGARHRVLRSRVLHRQRRHARAAVARCGRRGVSRR
jgi:hypothetical protein